MTSFSFFLLFLLPLSLSQSPYFSSSLFLFCQLPLNIQWGVSCQSSQQCDPLPLGRYWGSRASAVPVHSAFSLRGDFCHCWSLKTSQEGLGIHHHRSRHGVVHKLSPAYVGYISLLEKVILCCPWIRHEVAWNIVHSPFIIFLTVLGRKSQLVLF